MIDLYSSPSPNGRKISIMLEELSVEYNPIFINLEKKEQFTEEFSKISPSNKIPVIVDKDNDQVIFESGAIIDYIIEKYDDRNLKPSVESRTFPNYLQWYHYCEGMVMPPMNTIVVHTLIFT